MRDNHHDVREYEARVLPDGHLSLPPHLRKRIEAGARVRVQVRVPVSPRRPRPGRSDAVEPSARRALIRLSGIGRAEGEGAGRGHDRIIYRKDW